MVWNNGHGISHGGIIIMDLTQARNTIDALDQEITLLLSRRFAVVDKVSDYKAEHGLPIHDPARESLIISHLKANLNEAFREDVAAVYQCLFEISRARQTRRQKVR
jgi:chorismate mutase